MIQFTFGDEPLTKKEKYKLNFFIDIFQNEIFFIDSICQKYSLSNRVVKSTLIDLQLDIHNLTKTDYFSISNEIVHSEFEISQQDLNTIYHALQYSYYDNSLLFNFLNALFTNNSISLYDLAELLNISYSYIFKVIKNANQHFHLYNIDININVSSNSAILEGSEVQIRSLMYFYNLSAKNSIEKFNEIHLKSNKNQKSEDFYDRKTTLLTEIFKKRINLGKSLPSLDSYYYLEEILDKMFSMIGPQSINFCNLNEELAYTLFITYVNPSAISMETRIDIGKSLWKCSCEHIDMFKKCLIGLESNKNLKAETKYVLIYEYYLRYINYKYFDLGIYKKIIDKKKFSSDLITSIQVYLKNNLFIDLDRTSLDEYFYEISELTYSFLDFTFDVKIYFLLYQYSSSEIFIQNLVSNFFCNDRVKVTQSLKDADLVITNAATNNKNDYTEFFFWDINSLKNWEKLISKIQELILLKTNLFNE